ncbi:hypothetical protein Q3G72_008571 [Acer saccharum]|nr:hypothetical protein Q3G72_008571 [Acer saccharum]
MVTASKFLRSTCMHETNNQKIRFLCSDFTRLMLRYNSVIQSWQLAFSWEQGVDFQVQDVKARVLTEMAWGTMKTYIDIDSGPFNVTNVFEFHNGRWAGGTWCIITAQ